MSDAEYDIDPLDGIDESHGASVTISKAELLAAIQYDCVAFLSFYLGDELSMEVPDFHEEIWDEFLAMVEKANHFKPDIAGASLQLRKLFAVPREHAKSTLAKLAVILFLKYTKFKFVLYVSKTNQIAKNAIRDILMWLSSQQEKELFGKMLVDKSDSTASLWIMDIVIRKSANEPPTYKKCIFKALGADQQVRGTLIMNVRPQIVVIDDIEDLENTTADQQPKLDEWFMGSLLKSFSSMGYICVFIGNMIRKTTLLARLSKEPKWNPTVFGSLVRDQNTGELRALWKGKNTVESLLEEYAEFRRMGAGHVWEAEMMNLTQDEILQKDLGDIVRIPIPSSDMLTAGCLCLDPAFGENAWNDDSAITVHVRLKGLGIPAVVDSARGKWGEVELFENMIELSYKWGITTWCIEADAAQKLLIPLFRLLMQERKMNPGLFMMLPLSSSRNSKGSRIIAFRSTLGAGSYAMAESEEEIIMKIAEYQPTDKKPDDLVDSAAYGPIAWASYNDTITFQGIKQVAFLVYGDPNDRPELLHSYQVASF